jgi:two-component system OmpR family sensor kinase
MADADTAVDRTGAQGRPWSDVRETDAAAPRRRGIAWRVALVVIASAAVGALLAAVIAIFTVDQLLAEQTDQRLRGAVTELAGELDEDPPQWRERVVGRELEDENEEISSSGIRLAVLRGDVVLAGDAAVPRPSAGTCVTRGVVGGRVRACGRAYGRWVLVAAQPSDVVRLRWFYVLAALGALALGAGLGAALSVGLTRWAVAPLTTLTRALRRSRPEHPNLIELGPPSNCRDIEAIRSALRELIDRVQVLLDQARRFAADAAHELRTPLTTLRAELELLAEERSGSERQALDRACARASRLSDLVERLLVLALPGERLAEGFETLSIGDLVGDVIQELGDADTARVQLELASEGLVRGDAQLLRCMLSNAVRNALKFGPGGPVTVRVDDRPAPAASGAGHVALELSDTGPGIRPELRRRVFEPFYRAQHNAAGGHGLGLALIGHIARVHGGRAEFLDVAEGARLLVLLPAWIPASRPESA